MDQPHNVIVLGSRDGNIGGAIRDKLGADGDDCWSTIEHRYIPPTPLAALGSYDACVITLGTTFTQAFADVSAKDFEDVLYGSLLLPLECARRYVHARGDDGGRIVFIGSYAHDHPFTHCTSYCVAKAGLDMAVRSLAWELMQRGDWRVHIIHPFHVQGTPMTEAVLTNMERDMGVDRAGALAYQRKDLRMPNLLSPEEIARVVHWLLYDPAAEWTSGTGIKLYGGVR